MKLPGLDKLKKIVKPDNSSGKEADAISKTPSPVKVTPFDPGSLPGPSVPPLKKPPKKPTSLFDEIYSLIYGGKRKGTKPKTKTKPPTPLKTPPASPGKAVKPAKPHPSLTSRISSLFHRGKGKAAKPQAGQKTDTELPATPVMESSPSTIPELTPYEMELYGGKKTSSLDSLKRAFHVESVAGKKDTTSGKTKKVKKIVPHYDPVKEGVLVEPALPEGYREIDHYWVDVGESLVVIALNEKTNQNEYLLFEPVLSEFQYELIERVHADLRNILILDDDELVRDKRELLIEKMDDLFHEYGINPDLNTLFKLQYYLIRNFLGWGRIEALMKDPYIEDISCDGTMIPLFLYHRKYRNIKTNITFKAEILDSLAITLAQRSGKHISTGSPIIDATLPEGSRLQLTFGKEVTTRGTSFTIRKFREEPFSPIELLENGTFNEDQLVYFWMAIENNKSLLFIGGTASGKTTSLNATSLFIPPMAKVVSIEDTREITLFHENWIASVTRDSIAEGASMISMFDLLRAAMRQRPEYIIVGEVRGAEAQTLFQAMNTGHTTFSTLHAGNVDAAIHRLESEPLNVPRNMLQALNVISVQALVYRGQERIRRVQEIVEIAGADPVTGSLRVNTVFTYDPVSDKFSYQGRSQVYADIAEKRGWSREQLEDEIRIRKMILIAMKEQGMLDYISVSQLFQAYNIDAAGVIESIGDLKAFLKRGV
ncbi:MAG: type II/IV secretion system ATPase subunit [Methanomicrobiales archaeon]